MTDATAAVEALDTTATAPPLVEASASPDEPTDPAPPVAEQPARVLRHWEVAKLAEEAWEQEQQRELERRQREANARRAAEAARAAEPPLVGGELRDFAETLAAVVCPIPSATPRSEMERLRRDHEDLAVLGDRASRRRERDSLEFRLNLERLMGRTERDLDPWLRERQRIFFERSGQWF